MSSASRRIEEYQVGGYSAWRLNDDFAGLKKDFQGDFTIVMPLNMFGTQLLERHDNLREERGFISECDHEEGIGMGVGVG